MSFRAAIIGCGHIAEEHALALAQVEGISLAAYCDTSPERSRSMLDRFGGAYSTVDVDRVLSDDAIDAVYICTYHDTHAPLAVRASGAGKHIMLEKPMALTIPECEAIGEAVEQTGVTLMTAFKLRYYPMVARAKGFIAQPTLLVAQVMDNRWPDGHWAQDPVTGGGNVLSQGCHAMDLLYHLNGSEPATVYAEGGTYNHSDTRVIDTMVATIRFANGGVASIAQGDGGTTPFVSKFSFQMSDGGRSVHLHDRLKTGTFYDGVITESVTDPEELGMLGENIAFSESLHRGTPPPTTWRDGLRATTMVLKAFDAMRTGVPQTFGK